ncbi:MAG TPA: flagellar biosynthesis protein FlhA [Candidatus Krumholzibacteria bacterium]|nr:flagellar biosynthesis protein FlhA [Candidatus Krumholzibacteria bacterium]HPD71610.1 flagellar biosynthesis protein FlhA [Candidatus Krumholzibacteria bacterium]HRY41457.1 flagellar biosynthesis protein FlhA [Candidatus Krumholzibacteria bacterium]
MDQEKVISRDLVLANSNIMSAVAVLVILSLMVIPVSPVLLDVMLTFSIAMSVVVMLVALYLKEPLQFSTFPSLLLVLTLYRLSLNIASTRLILSRGQAGQVIQSFGDFVIGGNYVIGVIVFVILVIVNFLVITKGATRIAEVAARFTLDAMPGKQMAIDADLNAGLITEKEARQRRAKIGSEAEFFGAMDGASKFVRGDAIAGIIITIINVAGGFVIGMTQLDMSASEALGRFTLLTVGDGLVSQIPALLVSTAAGLVVTRSSSDLNLGQAVTLQIFRQRKALDIAGAALGALALIPGLPTVPFLLLAAVTFGGGRILGRRVAAVDAAMADAESAAAAAAAPAAATGPRGEDLFVLDRLELEIGYGLIGLVDEPRGGDLLQRIGNIRRQISAELGVFIHPIRVRDNLQLQAGEYVIKLKGVPVARAELRPNQLLAMSTRPDAGELAGSPTVEPAFNLPAVWIETERRREAEAEGYTVVEAPAVLATHLSEIIRSQADELLSRQDVRDMCESVREFAPALVEELIPDKLPVNTLHNVLRALLHERIPVRDIVTILETLANHYAPHAGVDYLTGKVREALFRTISQLYTEPDGAIHVISLHPETEHAILEASRQSEQSGQVVLNPRFTQEFMGRLDAALRAAYSSGAPPVLLVPTPVRFFVKRLIEPTYPNLAVMGYTEVSPSVRIQSAGTVVTHGHAQPEHQGVG